MLALNQVATYIKTKGTFYCPHCRLITHDSLLQELKTTVVYLTKEVISLKAAKVVVGKSNPELHSPLQLKTTGYPTTSTAGHLTYCKTASQTPATMHASADSYGSSATKNTNR